MVACNTHLISKRAFPRKMAVKAHSLSSQFDRWVGVARRQMLVIWQSGKEFFWNLNGNFIWANSTGKEGSRIAVFHDLAD